MFLYALRDAFLLFLMVYGLVDLIHRIMLFFSRRIISTYAGKTESLIPLFILHPDCAEYQIRSAAATCSPLWLITDAADEETLTIAKTLATEYESIILISKAQFFENFNPPKEKVFFSASSKVGVPDQSKPQVHPRQP